MIDFEACYTWVAIQDGRLEAYFDDCDLNTEEGRAVDQVLADPVPDACDRAVMNCGRWFM